MKPLRILFISPLDRRVVANTREQNMADACREAGHTTLSLTLAQNTSRAWRDILRDALSWRTHTMDQGDVVCIDPPLNPCTGLHTNLQSAPQAQAGPSLRARVIGFLAPLGVLRDVVIIPVVLLHALRRGHFDVCIAYGPWAACVGWILRGLGRVDVLVYDDQDYEPAIMRNPVRQRWAVFLERTMMQRADTVVSVGERLAALRRSQTGRSISVIPNGVRHATPVPAFQAPAGTERCTSASAAALTLIYVGNVVPWSGLDEVLQALALALASTQATAIRVLIVGDGLPSYVQSLRDQVVRLGLAHAVNFVGRVPNTAIGPWLAQADVGLALFRPEPYRRYAFPLKVVEYMQAGLAVLGTQDTETEDILRRHNMGIAVPFSAPAIADAMLQLVRGPTLLAHFQHNSHLAVQQYLWSSLTSQELALAQQALSARTKQKGT